MANERIKEEIFRNFDAKTREVYKLKKTTEICPETSIQVL